MADRSRLFPLFVAALLVTGLAHAQQAAPCEPGRGTAVTADDLLSTIDGGGAPSVPRNGSLTGAVDHRLFCGEIPEQLACFVPGPVELECVRVVSPIDLRHVVITGDLELNGAVLDAGLRLEDVQILGSLQLDGAQIRGDVILERVFVSGSVSLEGTVVEGRFAATALAATEGMTLAGARVQSGVEIKMSSIGGDLDLGLAAGASLSVAGAYVNGIVAGSQLALSGDLTLGQLTAFTSLEADGVKIGGGARIAESWVPEGLRLNGAVLGDVAIDGLVTEGELELDKLAVGGNLTLERSQVGIDVALAGSSVGRSLRIESCQITGGVDLSESVVSGELAVLSSRFGDIVDTSTARLTGNPRVAGCTPANPFAYPEDEEVEIDYEEPDDGQ